MRIAQIKKYFLDEVTEVTFKNKIVFFKKTHILEIENNATFIIMSGIQEKSSKKCHLSELKGCTVAVDSYCLLHRGAFGCAEKLIKDDTADGYVTYCMKYIKMLLSFNIKPVMVFDGQHLPAKADTEKKRREQRTVAKKRAAEYLRTGNIIEYKRIVVQGIDITHAMALKLIQECRKIDVDCIVAPYEADAQMAYLNIQKIVDVVITEDSDLVLFGCKKILFKLDLCGVGTLIDADKLYLSMNMSPDQYTFDKFRYMCILSGCDYLPSLPGIGIKKALKFLKLTAETDIYKVLPKLPSYLNMRQLVITDEYRKQFMIADATFKHQIVYDPIKRRLVHLTDPNICGTNEEYLCSAGKMFDEQTAFQLALGNIDPFTHKQMDSWSPDKRKSGDANTNSIWSRLYTKPQPRKSLIKINNKPQPSKETNVNKQLEVELLEKEKEAADIQLEKELQMYLQPCCSNDTENEESDEIITEKESPVLNKFCNNPFVKSNNSLKKLSKFNRTSLDEKVIVKSRFFSKDPNSVNTPLLSAVDNYNEHLKSDIATNEKTDNTTESDVENLTPSVTTDLIEETSTNVNTNSKPKLGSCPRVGLQRKKSLSKKNQPTLLTMFNKMTSK